MCVHLFFFCCFSNLFSTHLYFFLKLKILGGVIDIIEKLCRFAGSLDPYFHKLRFYIAENWIWSLGHLLYWCFLLVAKPTRMAPCRFRLGQHQFFKISIDSVSQPEPLLTVGLVVFFQLFSKHCFSLFSGIAALVNLFIHCF